jgi:heat shock protein HslJ
VVQHFGVAPTTIEQGQSVMASWTTGGGTTYIELLVDGEVILTDTKLENSVPVYPPNEAPATIKYTLIAYNNAGEQDSRDATVQIVPAPPQNPLANTNWRLLAMQGPGDVPSDVSITAYFGADGSLSGSGGCNSYTTSYVANGDVITIHAPVGTGAVCGDPMDSFEQSYLGLLPQAANFEIQGGQLIIFNNGGAEILRYNPN